MDFNVTDEQEMLRDSVRRWVDKAYDFERHRQIAREGGFSREAWKEIAELGLTGLVVPEAHGGMGFGPVDAMVVMEELGRGIVVEPFAAVALVAAGTLTSHANSALQSAWLPRIASGEAMVVLAHQERAARYRLDRVSTRATRKGSGWVINGAKSIVPAGDCADAYLVPARVAGEGVETNGIGLFLVERTSDGVTVRGYPTQDGGRAGELALKDAPAVLITEAGFDAVEHAVDIGIAAIAAEAVGVMDKFVALTIDYMNTRKQFGVVIGSFQALRHRIADVKMQLELARSMSYFATLKLNESHDPRRRALAQAKLQINQSARFVGQQCLQLHGGIGVTDEYIGSHYFKRLTMIELAYGDNSFQLGEVSSRMLDTAGVFA